MMKHLSALFLGVAPQCIELEQLPLSTSLKTKRETTRIKRLALCALCTAQT